MQYADLILKSNAVFTGLGEAPVKGFVALAKNRILAVGSEDDMKQFKGPSTQVITYEDNLILPGFIDSHAHLDAVPLLNSGHIVPLFGAKSEFECVERLKKHLWKHPELEHVTGMGWSLQCWDKKDMPSKASLDAVTTAIPVFMIYADGNTAWLNSTALEQCGFTKNANPTYGSLDRDSEGRPTGIVYGSCHWDEINMAYSVSNREWPLVKDKVFQIFPRNGITSLGFLAGGAAQTGETWFHKKLAEAEKNGELTIRVHLFPSMAYDGNFESARSMRDKYNSEFVRFSGLKQFVDGTSGSRTALLLKPYGDKPEERHMGAAHLPREYFMKNVPAANKEGFSVRLHAGGDAAARIALDAMEKSAELNDMTQIRNCVEHAKLMHPDDITRLKQAGVTAAVQPYHLIGDNNDMTEKVGKERARNEEWQFRRMLEAGVELAFGTDYPIIEFNPMLGVHAAVTRCSMAGTPIGSSPEQVITLAEALKAYTRGSAYAINREKDLGTLEAGKLADIVVMDTNLFDMEEGDLYKAKPVLTVLNGKIVFQA